MYTRRKFLFQLLLVPAAVAAGCRTAPASTSKEEDIRKRVYAIISEKLEIRKSRIRDDSNFIKSLGADSLDTVELIMEFEKEFKISIPDAEAEKMMTPGAAIRWIARRKK